MKQIFILILTIILLTYATPFDDDLDIYDPLSDSQIRRSDLANNIASEGVREVLARVQDESEIFKARDFYLARIQRAWRLKTPKATFYKFSVRLEDIDDKDLYIQSNFTMQYIPSSDSVSLVYYEYAFNFDESRNEKRDYDRVSRKRYDGLIKRLLNYGVDQVLLKARGQEQIPNKKFYLSEINSISKRRDGDTAYYKFEVELEDQDGDGKIYSVFIVMYLLDSGRKEVIDADYWYDENDDGRPNPPEAHADRSDYRPSKPEQRNQPEKPKPEPQESRNYKVKPKRRDNEDNQPNVPTPKPSQDQAIDQPGESGNEDKDVSNSQDNQENGKPLEGSNKKENDDRSKDYEPLDSSNNDLDQTEELKQPEPEQNNNQGPEKAEEQNNEAKDQEPDSDNADKSKDYEPIVIEADTGKPEEAEKPAEVPNLGQPQQEIKSAAKPKNYKGKKTNLRKNK